jgi:ATP-dependent exoDNAse (exonuclease V) beta subunit
LRRYREWKNGRAGVLERGAAPRYRVAMAESVTGSKEADGIPVETVTLPIAAGRPTGRKFGRVVHDILQHATSAGDVDTLAETWGRRHAASDAERTAAAEASRQALEYLARIMPAGAERHRELPVMVRLEDGMLVDGRIDFAWRSGNLWTVVDYKTDRREKRNITQVQLYALALEKATKIPARGMVLEV